MTSRRPSPTAPAAARPGAPGASPWRASGERRRDRELKREAVIRTAAREFNRKGYHNTSLDDIATALEVTKPTVYYYVTSKEQLLFECFVAGVEQIRAAFRSARQLQAPARERLNAVLRHYGEAVGSEFGWCMVRAEDQDLSPAMSRHIKQLKSEIDQGIRRLIRESAGIGAGEVQEVIMGCVLPAGLGQAPARQAALGAGVPIAAPATTLNKMCGSGLKAVMMAADQIRSGTASIVLAGGLESMSNAPYLLPKARSGYRMGHGEVIDHMLRDGLQSPFDGKSMGCFADATASKYGFTRAQQDAFATESVRRAMRAMQGGEFDTEVAPLTVKGRKGDTVIARDETPGTCDVEKIPSMKRAFSKEGTVAAAGPSSISDGAAALVLMDAGTAASRGLKPLVRILAYASHAQEPEWFTTAPVGAIRKVLTQLAWKPHD